MAREHDRRVGADVFAASRIGLFEYDVQADRLVWDERMHDVYGVGPGAFDGTLEALVELVHPEDATRVRRAIAAALEACGEYDARYRVVRPDGATRWVIGRGRVLAGDDGRAVRFVGAAYDATEIADMDATVARELEIMPTAFVTLDHDLAVRYVNGAAEKLLQRTRDQLVGRGLLDTFPAVGGTTFEHQYRLALRTGRPVTFTARHPAPLDAWYEVHAWPGPHGLSIYFSDVDDRVRAEQAVAAATRRAAVRARVATELSETLDADEAVARLATIVVPAVGDWCVVTLVDSDHPGARPRTRDVGTWHVDPERRALVAEYARVRLASLTPDAPLRQALRTGEVVRVTSSDLPDPFDVVKPGRARDLLTELAPQSAVVLPLRGRGRTVGAISLFNGADRGPVSDVEVDLLRDVAGRAGMALDNARLYHAQLRVAEELQRSMLTDPPHVPGLATAVRYAPASQVARVGGDWYDAFGLADGSTTLVIGDVVGHDVKAAADMGQVRALLRGIAVATQTSPSVLLTQVDRALHTLGSHAMATAVVASVGALDDPTVDGPTTVRWSNAGHPPPVLVEPDGTVRLLSAAAPEPLLGVLPDRPRTTSELPLRPGATLLLYTDGLVERRDMPVREGIAHLQQALASLHAHTMGLDDLCDAVLHRLLPPDRHDDVALLAVRRCPRAL